MVWYLFTVGIFLIIIGLIWLAIAQARKRSRNNAFGVLIFGLVMLVWSIVLASVRSTGLAWTINVVLLLILLYLMGRRIQAQKTKEAPHGVPFRFTDDRPNVVRLKQTDPSRHHLEVTNSTFDYLSVEKKIPQLKRESRFDEALPLLEQYIEATETNTRDSDMPVRSWPYQQSAIIYRKVKNSDAEIEVLERFARQPNSSSKQSRTLLKRLAKTYVLAGQADGPDEAERMPLLLGQAILIDCETTGFSRRDEIIDLALIAFEYSRATGRIFETIDQYTGLREPRLAIPPDATAVHGLDVDDVRGHTLDEKQCRRMFDAADVLIAHNASFDRRFVGALFPEVLDKSWLCSMNGVNWKTRGHSSKALQSLLDDFSIDPDTAHRALADADATLQLIAQVDPGTGETYFAEMLDKPAGNSR